MPMRNKHPRMKLSREEETFLRHWMYDELRYQQGTGPTMSMQLKHGVPPADLAALMAASFPDLADQEAAGFGPPTRWARLGAAVLSRIAHLLGLVVVAERPGPRAFVELRR